MKVLVIIVSYNAMRWIDRCLQSVLDSSVPADIYVIDNGSTDHTQEYIQKHYPQVMSVQSKENLGFGRANNIGLQYALQQFYDYVYLLNQDAWLMPDTLEKLIAVNRQFPEYGVLSPFQLQGNGQNIDVNFVSGVCSYQSNSRLINDLYFGKIEAVYEVPDVMAAHWLVSRDCLRKVGGFSPTFPHYGEDNNYAQRVLYHGFKLGIVPAATAVHDRENRAKLTTKQKMYRNYIGSLVTLSNIHEPIHHSLLYIFAFFCVSSIRLASFAQFSYLFKVWRNYRFIRSNRNESKKDCAFLVYD